jgi:plastocyanin
LPLDDPAKGLDRIAGADRRARVDGGRELGHAGQGSRADAGPRERSESRPARTSVLSMRRLRPRTILVVAVALSGCGGDGRERAAPSTPTGDRHRPGIRSAEHDAREARPPAYTEPGGTPIAPEPQGTEPDKGTPGSQDATGGKVDVSIRDRRFAPRVMRVAVGQIVVFTDDDDTPHTVRARGRPLPHSGLIPVGGRFEFTPLAPGTIRYHCIIHRGMRGQLIVRRSAAGPAATPPRPPCRRLRASARHELGDPGGEIERHCARD